MKAYEVIETYGWRQEEYGDTLTGYCLLGAIRKAYHSKAWQTRIRNKVNPLIAGENLWVWNDTVGRTETEVIAILKRAEGGVG